MKLDCVIFRDLRVLRGRQALKHVTEAESSAEGFVVSSAERATPLGIKWREWVSEREAGRKAFFLEENGSEE